MRILRNYRILFGAALRSELQYRANFLIMILGGLCYQGVGLAFIWAVLARFPSIGGWSLREVAFLYGIRLAAHSLWIMPGGSLLFLDWFLRDGDYDRVLIRPVNPLVQVLTHRLQVSGFGDFVGGAILLAATSLSAPVDWSPLAVVFLLLTVVGGALTEGAVQLAASTLSFRTLNAFSTRLTIDTVMGTFGSYPLSIFGRFVEFCMTFILPVAFIAYLPASVLLGRGGELAVPAVLAWGAPLIGVPLFALAYRLWVSQSRHYTSSGT